jgi:hypothetical protein
MLSAHLGMMNIPNIVIEKEAEITTDPRGIALGEDGIFAYSRAQACTRLCTRKSGPVRLTTAIEYQVYTDSSYWRKGSSFE